MRGQRMKPNRKGRMAYQRGYEAAKQGKTDADNPYHYFGAATGIGLSAWWSTGFTDQHRGAKQRWQPTAKVNV